MFELRIGTNASNYEWVRKVRITNAYEWVGTELRIVTNRMGFDSGQE
jgi:hypothetical protein